MFAQHQGAGQVLAIDLVPERLERARAHGVDAINLKDDDDLAEVVQEKTGGRGPDSVTAGIDRLSALHTAIELVRRGGTVSLSGVYGGAASPMPLIQMFDKQINLRMGQANVKRRMDDLLPLVSGEDDPLGVESFVTHHVPLEEAPAAYEMFQKKEDGALKVVFKP